MLQLRNRTAWSAMPAVLPDARGVDTFYVVVKGTWRIEGRSLRSATRQEPVMLADAWTGEPGTSSLRVPGDLHLGKPGTDVIVLGSAHSPSGRPVGQMEVAIAVGPVSARLLVTGDRVWRWSRSGGTPSDPQPFTSMPLVYERAYGGTYARGEGAVQVEERNPIGRGFLGDRQGKEIDGLPLPNIEDPRAPMRVPTDRPAPAGCAPLAPSWQPRRGHAGTYDDTWRTRRAPFLPDDFDPRFFQAAHPSLVAAGHLRGGEAIEIAGMLPGKALRCALPSERPAVRVRLAGREHRPEVRLETVLLKPEEATLCLTWRAALPCDKQALRVEEAEVERAAG